MIRTFSLTYSIQPSFIFARYILECYTLKDAFNHVSPSSKSIVIGIIDTPLESASASSVLTSFAQEYHNAERDEKVSEHAKDDSAPLLDKYTISGGRDFECY